MVRRIFQPVPRGLWSVWFCQSLNRIRWARPSDGVRAAILFLLGVAFVCADYLFFYRLWTSILSSPLPAIPSIRTILSSVLSLFLLFLFYSNLLSCLSTMYASRELSLLISSPVKFRNIFAVTFLATVSRSSAMFVLFGLPAIVALGRAAGVSIGMLSLEVPFLFPFLAIPGAAGLTVCHGLMRVLPRRRVHQTLLVIGLCVGAALIAGLRMLRIEYLWGEQDQQFQVLTSIAQLARHTPVLLPAEYLVDLILAAITRRHEGIWGPGTGLVGLSLLSLAVCYFVTIRWYTGALSDSRSVSDLAVRSRSARLPFLSSPVAALVTKETRCIRRQLHRWSQVLMMVPLLTLYVLNLVMLPIRGEDWAGIVVWINLGVVGFLVAAVSARFLVPAVSVDGPAYWIVRVCPIRTSTVVLTKFVLYTLPVLALALGCCAAIQLLIPAGTTGFVTGLLCTFLLTLTLSAMAIGIGAAFPRFDAQNDLEISLGAGGLLYMLLALLFVGFSDWWLLYPFVQMLPQAHVLLPERLVSLPWRVGVFAVGSMVCGATGLAFGIWRFRGREQ